MAAETGISSRAIKKHLANLQAAALIQRIGPDNGGKWVVVEQDMSEKQQICWQQNTVGLLFCWRQTFEGADGVSAFKAVMVEPH